MRAVPGVITLPANTCRLICSVPIKELHNIAVKAAGTCAIGGADVQTDTGLLMESGDISAWNWQDFRQDEAGNFALYGIAAVATTVSYLIWRR